MVGFAARPLTAEFCETALIKNTMSLAWRLGRAVDLANKQANVSNIGSVIVDVFGGPGSAKVLFAGKIVHVDRRVYKGHTIGEVVIVPLAASEADDTDESIYDGSVTSKSWRVAILTIVPFKNENLVATHTSPSGEKTVSASCRQC